MTETIYNAGQIPLAPNKREARLDKGTWWFECPVCDEPLNFKQKLCGCCSQRIDWGTVDICNDENPNNTIKHNWIMR